MRQALPARRHRIDGPQRRRPSLRVAAVVLLGVTGAAFARFLYLAVERGGSCWGFHDWPQFYAWYDLPRMALLRHGQLAFWNPYVSGGVPGIAHTHDPTFSPVFLVVLLFGAVTGTRVLFAAWVYLGMLSMFALARRFKVGRLGCYLAAVVWGLNGNQMLQLGCGHAQNGAMSLLPLVVLLFMRGRDDGPSACLTALIVAGSILAGQTYPAIQMSLLLAVVAVCLALLGRTTRWLSRLAAVAVCSMLFAAVKLVATVPYLLTTAPTKPDISGTGIAFLLGRLVSPEPPWLLRRFGNYTLGFWEFGAYVGVAAVVLFGVGLVAAALSARRGWAVGTAEESASEDADSSWADSLRATRLGALLIAAALFLLLSLGSGGPVDLFGTLRRVPLWGAVHVPFRFVTVPLMLAALVAGMGLDWMARHGRIARTAAAVLLLAVTADIASAYQYMVPYLFAVDVIDVAEGTAAASNRGRLPGYQGSTGSLTVADVGPAGDALFEQCRVAFSPSTGVGPGGPMTTSRRSLPGVASGWRDHYVIQPHSAARYLMQLQDRGNVVGYEMLSLRTAVRAVGDPGYRGEAYLQHGRGDARLVGFTPSRFTVEVDAAGADVVVLNQNPMGGWHVTIDGRSRRVRTGQGLVSAEVPAGRRQVVFRFRPDGFWAGLAVSVGSLLAVPLRLGMAQRRRRKAQA